jgi:hypothetical protein
MQIDFQAHSEDALKVSVTLKSREEFERFADQLFVVAEALWPAPFDSEEHEDDAAERSEAEREAQPNSKARRVLTPEEQRARQDRRNAQNRSYIAQMTPEERAEFRRRRTAQERARRENARRTSQQISRASTEGESSDYFRSAAAE